MSHDHPVFRAARNSDPAELVQILDAEPSLVDARGWLNATPLLEAVQIETRKRGYSEATPAIADALAATAAPWPEATRIDTAQPLDDSLAMARRAWQEAPGRPVAAEHP